MGQSNTTLSEQVEQVEHRTTPKDPTPPEIFPVDQSFEKPPPPKNNNEKMKDPAFLSSPVYPPIVPTKHSLSTTGDDHLIPLFSKDLFTFKAQFTSLYMRPTEYTFKLHDKIYYLFTSIESKYCFQMNSVSTMV